MNFFTDTNIPLGYTVIHDKWHNQSKRFIKENKNHVFWSNFVRKEYEDKLNDIIMIVDEFLKGVIFLLENNEKDFYSYLTFEKFIINRTRFCKLDLIKKRMILKEFWQKNNFTIGISTDIYSKFCRFVSDFEIKYIKRDLRLNEIMKLHDCGLDNYLNYYDFALKLYKNGIHAPDCRIVVDAHDCGLTHGNIVFISNDADLIESILLLDSNFLKIIEFRICDN